MIHNVSRKATRHALPQSLYIGDMRPNKPLTDKWCLFMLNTIPNHGTHIKQSSYRVFFFPQV